MTPATGAAAAAQPKYVYRFGDGHAEGDASMAAQLGGKGAGLAEMARLGLPVPPGFTIATAACHAIWQAAPGALPAGLEEQVAAALAGVEREAGRRFGAASAPLLVSVRSGAPVSMPGMMDTVLNLGLNDATVAGLAAGVGEGGERFARDSYRRFVQMYSNVVLGLDHSAFEDILDAIKDEEEVAQDSALPAAALGRAAARFRAHVEAASDRPFPDDPQQQLWGAIHAVFASWHNRRAVDYRAIHGISDSLGTAVTVQAMVFGNMGGDCATGVAFTRHPDDGGRALFGEFLANAQGEDVVAGLRTPLPIARASGTSGTSGAGGAGATGERDGGGSMEELMPAAFARLQEVGAILERHWRDMQDVEFTVEKGRLFMLQTRPGKRSVQAALKIAVDMAEEGLIGRDDALCRIQAGDLDRLLHPVPDPAAPRRVIARGLPGSPGAASGAAVFTAAAAQALAAEGRAAILVRPETSPEDIHGMHSAAGILTRHGGQTSHAALVARGMGRPCVTGASAIRVECEAGFFEAGGVTVRQGDIVTIDGSSGEVILGEVATVEPQLSDEFATLMAWADRRRQLRVRANAETPADAAKAREFGAEGIGLCRSEHMFFEDERIAAMREVILAEDAEGRRAPLARILPVQRADFVELFRIMAGLPVTVRLLDPPLHEFLPTGEGELAALAERLGVAAERLRLRAGALRELNPMLGHRGCRLGISHPEIYDMQARAVLEAALEAERAEGRPAHLEIMVPLVATGRELELVASRIQAVADQVAAAAGRRPRYRIGTMIELPRAALAAGEIARQAEFFSFGTNDLTQTAFGISRDDGGSFLERYRSEGIFPTDPFVTIDREGVGELIRLAARRGRAARPGLTLGICGEHGGDPASIAFCQEAGLDYVSCSPYRVPVARLAAAQAAIRAGATSGGGAGQGR